MSGRAPAPDWRAPRELDGTGIEARLVELDARAEPPWPGAALVLPRLPAPPGLAAALFDARRARRLVRGLEGAEAALDRDAAGRAATPATASERPRISRLLLLSADGAERFYRRVERICERHRPRLWTVILELDEAALGELAYGRGEGGGEGGGQVARALLVDHKAAAASVLDLLLGRSDAET